MVNLAATSVTWRKSDRSTGSGNDCVELAVIEIAHA